MKLNEHDTKKYACCGALFPNVILVSYLKREQEDESFMSKHHTKHLRHYGIFAYNGGRRCQMR